MVEAKQLSDDAKMRGKKDRARRGGAPRALARFVPELTAKALGKRGLAHANLIVDWPTVVGAEIASVCQPEKLTFRRGERSLGVLHLRVSGSAALELQHDTPRLVERINSYFGYKAVAEIRLLQVVPKAPPARDQPRKRRTLAASEISTLESTISHVDDHDLREILGRLGTAILSESHESTEK
tara:strand:+ start:148 stop:696 length:549 start_codon:yes stop_codon:yes gene_type:complete